MRYLLFLSLLLLNCQAFSAAKWSKSDWNSICSDAKKNNQYIFVDAFTDWCGWCKTMDKETFSDSTVGEFMNSKFISLKLDMEEGFGIKMALKYRVSSFPTFLVFNPDGALVYRIPGFHKPAEFLGLLNTALIPANQIKAKGISNKVDLDFPDFLINSMKKKSDKKAPDSAAIFGYLDKQKDLFNEVAWTVMAKFNLNKKYMDFFINNAQKYIELFGIDEVKTKLYGYIDSKIQESFKDKDESKLNSSLELIEKYYLEENKVFLVPYIKATFYQLSKNWSKLKDPLADYIKKSNMQDHKMVNGFCSFIADNCTDQDLLKSATDWMAALVKIDKEPAFALCHANLLYKRKFYKEAEAEAQRTIELYKAADQSDHQARELLSRINLEK
ncbi:MAG: DUF255 domain-containing protein [Candidatus Kapabacteria bacterium]|nr:DUF255 domain-containing protein [Candidatus Kapabacteria bacterium]